MRFALSWLFSGFLASAGLGFGVNTYVLHLLPYQQQHHAQTTMVLHATILHCLGASLGELGPFFAAKALARGLAPPWRSRVRRASAFLRARPRLAVAVVYLFGCWPSVVFDCCGVTAGLSGLPVSSFLVATALGKTTKGLVLLHAVRQHESAVQAMLPGLIVAATAVTLWSARSYYYPTPKKKYTAQNTTHLEKIK